MEDPVSEIRDIVRDLYSPYARVQRSAIDKYFTRDATLASPLCTAVGSKWLMLQIYQWFKILNPRVDTNVESVAFDAEAMVLFVVMHQSFHACFSSTDKSYADPVVVFKLKQDSNANQDISNCKVKKEAGNPGNGESGTATKSSKALEKKTHRNGKAEGDGTSRNVYYIQDQCQLYLPADWLSFNLPWGIGSLFALWWECSMIVLCLALAILLRPITWLHEVCVEPGYTECEKKDKEARRQK